MNEFNAELEKFIDETVKKTVEEHTSKIVEETVKKTIVKYILKTNNDLVLLQTTLATLMSILTTHRFPSMEELQTMLNKVLEKKAAELQEKHLGEKSEEPKS